MVKFNLSNKSVNDLYKFGWSRKFAPSDLCYLVEEIVEREIKLRNDKMNNVITRCIPGSAFNLVLAKLSCSDGKAPSEIKIDEMEKALNAHAFSKNYDKLNVRKQDYHWMTESMGDGMEFIIERIYDVE